MRVSFRRRGSLLYTVISLCLALLLYTRYFGDGRLGVCWKDRRGFFRGRERGMTNLRGHCVLMPITFWPLFFWCEEYITIAARGIFTRWCRRRRFVYEFIGVCIYVVSLDGLMLRCPAVLRNYRFWARDSWEIGKRENLKKIVQDSVEDDNDSSPCEFSSTSHWARPLFAREL